MGGGIILIYKILNGISLTAMTTLLICLSFGVIRFILSFFINLKGLVLFNKFYTWEIIIFLFSILLVGSSLHTGFITISSPWQKYIK